MYTDSHSEGRLSNFPLKDFKETVAETVDRRVVAVRRTVRDLVRNVGIVVVVYVVRARVSGCARLFVGV